MCRCFTRCQHLGAQSSPTATPSNPVRPHVNEHPSLNLRPQAPPVKFAESTRRDSSCRGTIRPFQILPSFPDQHDTQEGTEPRPVQPSHFEGGGGLSAGRSH